MLKIKYTSVSNISFRHLNICLSFPAKRELELKRPKKALNYFLIENKSH